MRHVPRGTEPELVSGDAFQNIKTDYESFRFRGGTRVTQTKMAPHSGLEALWSLVTPYVQVVFDGKCAYTEITATSGRVHLHRPEADAYDETLGLSSEHYWWTATWWRNWYLASDEIDQIKRNTFPVIGDRATVPSAPPGQISYDDLDVGVLLDPCVDRPEWHLRFHEDGHVDAWADAGAPWLDDIEAVRGPETTRLLDLDVDWLVDSRQRAIRTAMKRSSLPDFDKYLQDLGVEHLGAVRQVVAHRFLTDPGSFAVDLTETLADELAPLVASDPGAAAGTIRSSAVEVIASHYPDLATEIDSGRDTSPRPVSSPEPSKAPRPVGRTAALTRVLIKNFQAIEFAEFTIPIGGVTLEDESTGIAFEPDTALAGRHWKALLGENGTGKSSALKAIGLALASTTLPQLERTAGIRWEGLLRRGTTRGRVLLEFSEGSKLDLRFNANRGWFVNGPPEMHGFVRGFGATRLFGSDDSDPEANVRLGNLYDPRVAVVDAERWLLELENEGDFNVAAVALADLLGLSSEVTIGAQGETPPLIDRHEGGVLIGGETLDNLSDGYRSVIAMACDLMAGAGTGLSAIERATGIVLIDEIGAHLHPKWKMAITGKFRRVFRSMQFIVSTHEPLCLLGLVEDEVIRVTKQAGSNEPADFEEIHDSPSGYRVDRLLTSHFFGLDTTVDPSLDRLFQEYYSFLRMSARTDEQDRRMRTLGAQLSHHGVLGYTRRDQMVYEAIDRFLATERSLDIAERRRQREETLETVVDIWRTVAERRGVGAPR